MNQQAKDAAALADTLHKKLYEDKENTDASIAGDENTDTALDTLTDDVTIPAVDTPLMEPTKEEFETKFKVLQGKYNAEVPRFQREIRDLESTVSSMQTQLENLKTSPAAVAKDLDNTPLDLEAYAEYGPEFETLAKMVQDLTGQVNSLGEENTNLKASLVGVESTQADNVQESFINGLGAAVPTWETINKNPDFVQWLQEVEPISGMTRQQHLDNAAETLNTAKTITIFKQFNDSVATPRASNAQRIAQQAQPDSFQAPAPTDATKRSYTRNEIKQFYKETALAANGKGPWVGRDDEVKAIEADIFAAPLEGRIVG